MQLSNIGIVMIKFEMIRSSWKTTSKLLCWELDLKNNHEMEYDLQILVPSVNLIVRIFNGIFVMNI